MFGTDESWRSTPSHILGRRPHRGRGARPTAAASRLGRAGTDRPAGIRVRVADHGYDELCPTIGPPGPPHRGAPRRCRSPSSRRVATSSTSGRTSTAGSASTTSAPPAPSSRSPTASGSTPTATSPRTTSRIAAFAAASRSRAVPDRRRRSRPATATVFEPRHSTKGFQYVRIEGYPGPLDRRRRSPASSCTPTSTRVGGVRVLRRAHQPAPPRRRVELPGQRLRHPDRLPHPRALRVDRRLADLRRHRRLPLRRRRLLRQVAARPRSRPARPTAQVTNIVPDPQPGDDAARSGRTTDGSAGWGDAAVHVPWELYRATGDTDVLADQFDSMRRWVDFAAGRAATGPPPLARRAATRPAPARALPLGQRLALRRVARSRRRHGHRRSPSSLVDDHGPVATAYLLPLRRPARRDIAEHPRRPRRGRPLRASSPPTSPTPGAPSSSTPTARPAPTPRRTYVRALAFGLVPDDLRARSRGRPRRARSAPPAPTSAPASSPRRSCSRCSPTTATSTSPTSCCSRTPSRRGSHMSRPRHHDDLGGLGRRRRRRHRLTHSLNHYSKGAVISFLHQLRRRPPAARARLPTLPRRAPTRRRHHQRPHPPRLPPRPNRRGVATRRRRRATSTPWSPPAPRPRSGSPTAPTTCSPPAPTTAAGPHRDPFCGEDQCQAGGVRGVGS